MIRAHNVSFRRFPSTQLNIDPVCYALNKTPVHVVSVVFSMLYGEQFHLIHKCVTFHIRIFKWKTYRTNV
jgi:hypothetical protein